MAKPKHSKKDQSKGQTKNIGQSETKSQKRLMKQNNLIQNRENPDFFSLILLVKPNARGNQLYKDGEHYILNISAPPTKGKANTAIVKYLGAKLKISKSAIQLIRGHTSSTKTFSIFMPKYTINKIEEKLLN